MTFAKGDRVLCEHVKGAGRFRWGTVENVGSIWLQVRIDGDWTSRDPEKVRAVRQVAVRLHNPHGPQWLESDEDPPRYRIFADDGFVAKITPSDRGNVRGVARGGWDAGTCLAELEISDGAAHHDDDGVKRASSIKFSDTKAECEAEAMRAHALWKAEQLSLPKHLTWEDSQRESSAKIWYLLASERAAAEESARSAPPDPLLQLKKLGGLRDSGVLTEQEFTEAKARILDQL